MGCNKSVQRRVAQDPEPVKSLDQKNQSVPKITINNTTANARESFANNQNNLSSEILLTEQENEALQNFTVSYTNFVRKVPEDIKLNYKMGSAIGEGAFGEVRKVTHRKTGKVYAVKILPVVRGDDFEDEALMSEVNIMKDLDHANILKVYECYKDDRSFYMIMEYCQGGNVQQKYKAKQLNESDTCKIIYQILSGINYLHQNGIVHRDIKPENLLIDKPRMDGRIKIADFGVSRKFKKEFKMNKAVGSALYIAPEVLKGDYNEKCDVWSTGVLMYKLLSGKTPFEGETDSDVEEKVKKGVIDISDKVWSKVSKECMQLMLRLLEYDPKKRPTAADALKDHWFQQTRDYFFDAEAGKNALNSLRAQHKHKKLSSAIWIFMVTHFATPEEKNKLADIYEHLDNDQDGALNSSDIKNGFKKFGFGSLAPEELDEIGKNLDQNHDKKIGYSEFLMATVDPKKLLTNKNLEATFKILDKKQNKYITEAELKEFFTGDSQVKKEWDDDMLNILMKEIGLTPGHKITFEDFKKMMLNISQPKE